MSRFNSYFKNVVNEAYVGAAPSGKNQYELEVEQNDGNYLTITITANSLKKTDHTSVMADDVLINFDKLITRISRYGGR